MNRILTTLLFAGLAFAGFSQDDEGSPNQAIYEFEPEQTVYLLADSVNVRATPDIKGKTLDRLPIGTKVTILEATDRIMDLNGFAMPWYHVQYNGKKTGYIWGGKIALNSFRSSGNTDYVFHFGIEKQENGTTTYQIRVEKDHKQVQLLSFEGFGDVQKEHSCTNFGNRGLTNVQDVIYVTGNARFCADAGGSSVFFFADGKLQYVMDIVDVADAPVFHTETLIFPADMEGKKGVILFHDEAGEYTEDGVVYETNETTSYKWDGKSLVTTH